MKMILRFKGGSGSGNYGHAGRPGKRGGSAGGKSTGVAASFDHNEVDGQEVTDVGSDTVTIGAKNYDIIDIVNDIVDQASNYGEESRSGIVKMWARDYGIKVSPHMRKLLKDAIIEYAV